MTADRQRVHKASARAVTPYSVRTSVGVEVQQTESSEDERRPEI